MTNLIQLCEVYEDRGEEKERFVFINPAHIVTFHDDHLWRNDPHERPSVSLIRLVTGATLKVRESAACIAAEINHPAWGVAA